MKNTDIIYSSKSYFPEYSFVLVMHSLRHIGSFSASVPLPSLKKIQAPQRQELGLWLYFTPYHTCKSVVAGISKEPGESNLIWPLYVISQPQSSTKILINRAGKK